MWFIKYRKIFYIIASSLAITSIVFLTMWGLKLGIDFTGGTLWEMEFSGNLPTSAEISSVLTSEGLTASTIQPAGDKGYILRFSPLEENQHQSALSAMEKKFGTIDELRFEAIGPSIGKELRDKAIYAIFLSIIVVIIYVAAAFRKVEKVVSSWAYGGLVILSMTHDVLVPLGVFAVLGKFFNVEITATFVAAILTIAGYSINDTIVVFDRVRENLRRHTHDEFTALVGASIKQTIARSINTTLTTLLALVGVYFFGGESTKYFALCLIIGIFSGAYSSIFIASPLLVSWSLWRNK